jgi:peptidyl-prolyl cis-trans isomerase C
VVAEVNGRKMTLGMMKERLGSLPPEVGVAALDNGKEFLERFVQTELLYQEALSRKLDISPGVQSKILQARRRVMIEALVDGLNVRVARVSEEDMRRYFEKNRGRFEQKAIARIGHLVLRTKNEAQRALAEIRGGVSFEEVARKRSVFEESRKRGGARGVIRRGELTDGIDKVAFTLPVGVMSAPVKSPAGWHLIRVLERREKSVAKFEEVRGEVRKILTDSRRQKAFNALLDKLYREGRTVIYPDRLR